MSRTIPKSAVKYWEDRPLDGSKEWPLGPFGGSYVQPPSRMLLAPKKIDYRRLFFENNEPPYTCWECRGPLEPKNLVVHHLNRNHDDNRIRNLVAAHVECHDRLHDKEEGIRPGFIKCSRCGEIRPQDPFSTSYCTPCRREYKREHNRSK